MKKITVIIPVYNAEKHLPRVIDSIIKQTIFNELEVLFINDGSTDNTLKILNKVKNSNIKVTTKENGGVSSARNIGIEKTKTEFICFIDADDYIEDDYFETLLKNSEYDLVVNGYIAEYPNKKVPNKLNNDLKINDNNQIIYNYLKGNINPNSWGKLFKKSIIGEIRFNENLSHSEDRLFVFEYLKKCKSAYIKSNLKYHYIIHNESSMRKKFNKKMLNSLDVMEKISEDVKKEYFELYDYAKSSEIDSKCRVLSELYYFKVQKSYKELVKKIKYDINHYSILQKKKYSSKKHFFAFLSIRISPYLYNFLKNNLKLQYK